MQKTNELRYARYSPKAAEFTATSIPKFLAVYDEYVSERDKIINESLAAAYNLAASHDAEFNINKIEIVHDPLTEEYYEGCSEKKMMKAQQ